MVSPQGRLFRRLRHDETVHVLGASDVPRARPTSESLGGGEEHASEESAVFGVIDQIASLPAQRRYAAGRARLRLRALPVSRAAEEITAHRTSADPGLEQLAHEMRGPRLLGTDANCGAAQVGEASERAVTPSKQDQQFRFRQSAEDFDTRVRGHRGAVLHGSRTYWRSAGRFALAERRSRPSQRPVPH